MYIATRAYSQLHYIFAVANYVMFESINSLGGSQLTIASTASK